MLHISSDFIRIIKEKIKLVLFTQLSDRDIPPSLHPQTARRPKQAWLKQNKFFVIPNDEKCRALTLKYHFFNYRTIFPLQNVSFLAAKIPMGRKSFLSLSARIKRNRYRRKKCPIIKKRIFHPKISYCNE